MIAAVMIFSIPALSARAGDGISGEGPIALGAVPKYSDEKSAIAACKPDAVVWADAKTGFYYPKFFADYGKTAHGAYTCYRQAKKADYWSLSPASDGGHKGRQFPEFFCYACS